MTLSLVLHACDVICLQVMQTQQVHMESDGKEGGTHQPSTSVRCWGRQQGIAGARLLWMLYLLSLFRLTYVQVQVPTAAPPQHTAPASHAMLWPWAFACMATCRNNCCADRPPPALHAACPCRRGHGHAHAHAA